MAIHKTEAIVLRTFDFRETSLIVHFFSQEYGRIDGILKGIRKDPNKFASRLEPFSLNEIVFYSSRNSGLHLVSQCDLKENFSKIRNDLKSGLYASYIVELLERLMPEAEQNHQVYDLAVCGLRQLELKCDPEKVARIFLIKLLKLIGFRPRLDGCTVCDCDITDTAYFNVKGGGLLCQRCRSANSECITIAKGTIVSILHIEYTPWKEALRLGLNKITGEELDHILRDFLDFHLQVQFKSERLLGLANSPEATIKANNFVGLNRPI